MKIKADSKQQFQDKNRKMIQIDGVSDNEKCTFNKRVLKEYFKENKRTNTQLDKIEFTNESMTFNVKPWLGTQKIGE